MSMFKKKLFKNKKGYTLTELLVVIAILGVLAAIASPMIMGYIVDARQRADELTAATIENAVRASISRGDTTDLTVKNTGEVVKADGTSVPDKAYIRAAIASYFGNNEANIPKPQQNGFNFYLNTNTAAVRATASPAGIEVQVAP